MFSRFLLILTSLFLASCASPVAGLYPPKPGEETVPVYVVYGGGIHSALALLRHEIPSALRPAVIRAGAAGDKYVEIGWGEDDGFRKPITLGIACKSLLGSHRTVMKVEGCNTSPGDCIDDPDATLVQIDLTRAGFDRLCAFIAASQQVDEQGHPLPLGECFFRAHGKYSAFHTCNNWTADALRAAGCPIRPGLCQFPGPLVFQAKRTGKVLKRPDGFTRR